MPSPGLNTRSGNKGELAQRVTPVQSKATPGNQRFGRTRADSHLDATASGAAGCIAMDSAEIHPPRVVAREYFPSSPSPQSEHTVLKKMRRDLRFMER